MFYYDFRVTTVAVVVKNILQLSAIDIYSDRAPHRICVHLSQNYMDCHVQLVTITSRMRKSVHYPFPQFSFSFFSSCKYKKDKNLALLSLQFEYC